MATKKVMNKLNVVTLIRSATFELTDGEHGQLPLKTKITYGAPSFSLLSLTMLITIHGNVFYEEIGASLTFLAFFTALARSFDVITDPLMGWISDSTRTRWGRRRPYMAFGCIGYAVAFLAFMTPPKDVSSDTTAYWFGVTYIIFYLFDTIANVPYTALGPELTDSSVERESVYFWRGFFDKAGVLAGAAGPAIFSQWLSQRNSFTVLALIFGVYYVVTMYFLIFRIKEREKSLAIAPIPLVPSILRAFKNIAFRPLFGAWVFDYIALGMVSSMLSFFVKFVVVPNDGYREQSGDDPEVVLGIALGMLFVASAVAMPVWKWLSTKFGKRRIWLAYNLFNAVSTFFFLGVGRGDTTLLYILAFLNGIPIGGQFLIEAVLSDCIDYDEFLNASRQEGSFTVFATFIPKVVSIPASAIPLAIVSAVGFRSSINEVDQAQTSTVKNTIRVLFVLVPSVCMMISFAFKLMYPLRTQRQLELLHEGIVKHEAGLPAYDPVIDVDGIEILKLDEKEAETAFLLDNFAWDTLTQFVEGTPKYLSLTIRLFIGIGMLSFVALVVLIVLTFPLLDDDATAWIPSFSCILAGMALCLTVVSVLRFQAAKQLERDGAPAELVAKIIAHKKRGQRGGDTVHFHDHEDRMSPAEYQQTLNQLNVSEIARDNGVDEAAVIAAAAEQESAKSHDQDSKMSATQLADMNSTSHLVDDSGSSRVGHRQ
jgi:glycoside/pentoside/hexuronide:cation symporter, GPH family